MRSNEVIFYRTINIFFGIYQWFTEHDFLRCFAIGLSSLYLLIAFISWDLMWVSFVTTDARLEFVFYTFISIVISWAVWGIKYK